MAPDPVAEAKHSTGLHREIAEWGLIFECIAGSKLVGVNLDNADDDRMGLCIEPPEWALGLRRFEQYVGRTQPMGERSGEGDTDRVIYSLRKWAQLALSGNPTVLQLLFVPGTADHESDPEGMIVSWGAHISWWAAWMEAGEWFASKKAGKAFLGYMQQQRQRIMSQRGMRVNRPELVEAHGYDTKYAGHIIRLGLQGVEFLRSGYLILPMEEEERKRVLAVRRGEVDLNDVLQQAGDLEAEIKSLLDVSPLPDEPAYNSVNDALVHTYQQFYDMKGWRFP